MAKRFTDTDKWTKNKWFRKLPNDIKLFWLYILDNCDSVGVWEEDIEFVNLLLGIEYSKDRVLEHFGDRIKIINGGEKWWIVDFCSYQYGELREENTKNKPHQSYISQLKKYSLWIDYTKTFQSLKEKDKEKEKEKDKEKEGRKSQKRPSLKNEKAIAFQKMIDDNYPQIAKMDKQITDKEFERLTSRYNREEIIKKLEAMENKKKLTSKYVSVGKTLIAWLELEYGYRTKNG